MRIDQFPEFFQAIHGYPPFRWQTRLCEQVHRDRSWPELIDLPTSSGKTAVLDISIFLLALEAGELPANRISRLRTVFIVDRRLVVDEAELRVAKIAKALRNPNQSAILQEMAERLLSFGGEAPLKHSKMRGGMYHDDTWADRPNQPLVCLSTVDQVGSRLLFRGYQVTPAQRPIHAGLLANDSRLFIDEAHLSNPFLDTLSRIRQKANRSWMPGFDFIQMTATPREGVTNVFRLDPAIDLQDAPLADRIRASKPARLEEPKSFESDAIRTARELAKQKDLRVIAVVVNRVDSAREIFEGLQGKDQREAVLLTGRIRPWDREKVLKDHLDHLKSRSESQKPYFVVATQTVEVGADLDFHALVTEAASIDALRQRFGRLNRLGLRNSAPAVILKRKLKQVDPIYGNHLDHTWEWLQRNAQNSTIDFGVDALNTLLAATPPADRASLTPTRESGPVITRAHWDAWVQTNPSPEPDPDVAPFLHGKSALEAADISVVWRTDLSFDGFQEDDKSAVRERLDRIALAPPSTLEALPLPIGAVRRWLGLEKKAAEIADVEGQSVESEIGRTLRPFVVWQGPEDSLIATSGLRPGSVIVVPCDYGGCDQWGWAPASRDTVSDIGNEVMMQSAGRRVLRLLPSLLASSSAGSVPESPQEQSPQQLLDAYRRAVDEQDADEEERIQAQILDLAVRQYSSEVADWKLSLDLPLGVLLLREDKRRQTARGTEVGSREDQSNEDDLASFGQGAVTLHNHVEGVVEHVAAIAEKCGIPPELRQTLIVAAKLHDTGKADERFQALLHLASGTHQEADPRGDPSQLLAKSGGPPISGRRFQKLRKTSGCPDKFRHEFLSVALAENSGLLNTTQDPDLTLYLIGTHHGHGRAMAPWWRDPDPVPVAVKTDGETIAANSGSALRFATIDSNWTRKFWLLIERYGPWGLAYLETILRRADCLQSAWESEHATAASN